MSASRCRTAAAAYSVCTGAHSMARGDSDSESDSGVFEFASATASLNAASGLVRSQRVELS